MTRTRLLLAMGAAVALVLRPTAAHAQLDAFVQSVRDLAVANGQPEPARSNDVHAAARRMRTAVAEWDRNILALEARVARELTRAAGPRAYELRVELGVTYRARGRHTDALREFDAAAALKPSAADLQLLRALTFEATGRTGEAASAFSSAWMSDPRDAVKAYYVARRQGPEGAADQALARRQLTDAYQRLLTGTARPPAAPFLMLDAVADNLSRTPVVAGEAVAEGFSLLRAGRFGEAAVSLERSVPKGEESGNSAVAHFALGRRDEAEARVASARREYQAALPGVLLGRASLLVGIGRLAQVDGDLAGAIDAFDQAARLDPNNPSIRKELAGAYAAHGREADAFGELVAALLIDSRDGQAHAGIGQLYLDTGRDAEAVTAFNRALELLPQRYETRYALATAYTRLGRTAEAAREFALFEHARREKLDERRHAIAAEAESGGR